MPWSQFKHWKWSSLLQWWIFHFSSFLYPFYSHIFSFMLYFYFPSTFNISKESQHTVCFPVSFRFLLPPAQCKIFRQAIPPPRPAKLILFITHIESGMRLLYQTRSWCTPFMQAPIPPALCPVTHLISRIRLQTFPAWSKFKFNFSFVNLHVSLRNIS